MDARQCQICKATVMPGGVRTSMGYLIPHATAAARWCQYARERGDLHGPKQCVNPCPDREMDPTETFESRTADLGRKLGQVLDRVAAEFRVNLNE